MHAHVSVHVSVHALGEVCLHIGICCASLLVCVCVCVCVYPLTSNITTSILYCNTETSWLEVYFEE